MHRDLRRSQAASFKPGISHTAPGTHRPSGRARGHDEHPGDLSRIRRALHWSKCGPPWTNAEIRADIERLTRPLPPPSSWPKAWARSWKGQPKDDFKGGP